jgi:hypothetical protein
MTSSLKFTNFDETLNHKTIEIDDPVLSENDCVVNKSFNALNTSSTNQISDTNVNNDSSLLVDTDVSFHQIF